MRKALLLKRVLFVSLLFALVSVKTYSQVLADPGVSGFDITNLGLVSQNANELGKDYHYILKLPIFNSNQAFALPAGSCKIRVGLGSKAVPDYTVMTAPTINYSEYFSWTAAQVGGQWQVTGELIAPLPADFNGVIEIKIKPTVLLSSTFTANFLVTNHANVAPNILSDEDPTNNSTATSYTVIIILPVKFSSLDVSKSGCNIKVNFGTQEEINVDHYEIEASKDGSNFIKVGESAVKSQHLYQADFALTNNIQAEKIFVRIKSVDKDGRIQYSEIRQVSGICGKALLMNIYPNPVTNQRTIVINATQGLFNGKYKIAMRDFAGKLVQVSEVELNNAAHFDYALGNIAAGKYIVQVISNDGSESAVLQLQKL